MSKISAATSTDGHSRKPDRPARSTPLPLPGADPRLSAATWPAPSSPHPLGGPARTAPHTRAPMSDAFIVCSNLSFAWPDETPVFQDLSFTVGGGRTGLVAPNGAGKSTLLKLIAGEYRPSAGTATAQGMIGYLPQSLPLTGDLTVAEVLGIAEVITSLGAIESGDASEEHFTTVSTDWDIEERTRAQLDRLGLSDVVLTRRLDSLSGGQVVSLGLAAQLLKRPDVLLLDEPTNNLDLDARRKLYGVLEDWNGC